jgi:hypothetical protein
MEELNTTPPITDPQLPSKRQTLLTVLCILTFVGSGMNLVSSWMIAAFYDLFVMVIQEFADKFKIPGMDVILEAKPLFFFVSGIFYAGSIIGAALMMRLKKVGFHVYTICQILLVISPMYFMHLPGPNFLDILFSGTFIILYSTQLKFMH